MTTDDPQPAELVEMDAGELGRRAYPWLTALLVPRPIAWVSTVSAAGIDNVAPHSFTTVAGTDPAVLCFTSVGGKDTLRNVREVGEFVLHVGTAALAAHVNDSATNFPAGISEFDQAGLQRAPSRTVRPPRVAASPAAMECRVVAEQSFGNCTMVFGQLLHLAVRRDVLAEDGLPDPARLAPVTRLGRNQWAHLGEVFALDRIDWSDWQDGTRTPR